MSSTTSQTSKPVINLGTIGHVDHGKSTLLAALREILRINDTSSLQSVQSDESTDGSIKINMTYVDYQTANRRYHQLDLPATEEQLQKGNPLDGVVLVVDAADGPMPQTREQVKLVKQGSVSSIVVFLSKCDMETDEGLLDMAEAEIRDVLTASGYPGQDVPIVRGSALEAWKIAPLQNFENTWIKAILKLSDALDSYIPESKQA